MNILHEKFKFFIVSVQCIDIAILCLSKSLEKSGFRHVIIAFKIHQLERRLHLSIGVKKKCNT